MATAEERMKILEMVQDGKINAEEGTLLLQALQSDSKKAGIAGDPRWLHIRITDRATGQAKVNVNLPMSLVTVGIKAAQYLTENSTWQQPKNA